jgi:hypothetical protein
VSGDWQAGERVLELSARRDWVFGGIGSSSAGKSGKMKISGGRRKGNGRRRGGQRRTEESMKEKKKKKKKKKKRWAALN